MFLTPRDPKCERGAPFDGVSGPTLLVFVYSHARDAKNIIGFGHPRAQSAIGVHEL